MTTRFPDTDPLPDQAPDAWDAMPDWASVRTLDAAGRHKVITVYLDAPDAACAEAHEADGDARRVDVTVPRAFDDWGRVHRATEGLNALWDTDNGGAAPR